MYVACQITGHMKTVLMNMRDDFSRLMRLLPVDPTIDPTTVDPSGSGIEMNWALLRCPWQPVTDEEERLPQPLQEPPRKIIDKVQKSMLQKWFFKETLATQHKHRVVAAAVSGSGGGGR